MPTLRGGDGGRRELNRRVRLFDAGEWRCLIAETRPRRLTEYRKPLVDESRSINRAEKLVVKGELSHAARELTSNEVAPGTPQTYAELSNPLLRPPAPFTPIPERALNKSVARDIKVEFELFVSTLRQCMRVFVFFLFFSFFFVSWFRFFSFFLFFFLFGFPFFCVYLSFFFFSLFCFRFFFFFLLFYFFLFFPASRKLILP